ncbi:MAG: hypothetical protein ABI417_20290 [Coleofasciculaceae cyanobacterium]|jgi:hypothetical protein
MAMSFHEQNIEAFTQLLRTQKGLFSAQDRDILDKIADTLSDDYEKISETLATWYEKRDKILDAQLDMINSLISSEINARKSIASAIVSATAEEKDYKKELLEAIKTIAKSKNKTS